MLKMALALAYKDFQIESGKKTLFTSLLSLAFIIMFISSLTVWYNPKVKPELGALVIWLILIYISFQTLNKSLSSEEDYGCWDALCLCPCSTKVIYLGKLIYNSAIIIIVQLVLLPFYINFFDLGISALIMFIPTLLASIGFIGIGLLFALLSLNSTGRELMISVLSLPVLIPVLFGGLRATLDLSHGAGLSDIWHLIIYILAYDICFIGLAFLLFAPELSD